MEEKYAIISGDIHKLIRIRLGEDWSMHPWRYHEDKNLYWVPVPNSYATSKLAERENPNDSVNAHYPCMVARYF